METSHGALADKPGAPHEESGPFPDADKCICQLAMLRSRLPVRLARRETRLVLTALDISDDQVFEIEEAVAELATNAQSYAPPPWQLRIYLDHRWLWVGVFDAGARTRWALSDLLRRATAAPDPCHLHGRGLFLTRQACGGACWVRPAVEEIGGVPGKEVLLRFPAPAESAAAN